MTHNKLTIEGLGKDFQTWLAGAVPEFTVADTREFCAAFFAACKSDDRLRSASDLYPQTVYRIITEELLLPSTRKNRPHLALIGREFAIYLAELCPTNWRELDAVLHALGRFSQRDRASWLARSQGFTPSGVAAEEGLAERQRLRPGHIRRRLRKVSWDVGEVCQELEKLLGLAEYSGAKPTDVGPSLELFDLPLVRAVLRLIAWVEAGKEGVRQVGEDAELLGWDIPSAAGVVRLGDPDAVRRARSMEQAPWLGLLWQNLVETGAVSIDRRGRAACSMLCRKEGLRDLAQEFVRLEADGEDWKSLGAERWQAPTNALVVVCSRVLTVIPETEDDALTLAVLENVTTNVIGSLVTGARLNIPSSEWKDPLREIMMANNETIDEVKIDYQVESLFLRLRSWLAGHIELGTLTLGEDAIEVVPPARFLYLDALTGLMEEAYPDETFGK